jgi:hypothetical protein
VVVDVELVAPAAELTIFDSREVVADVRLSILCCSPEFFRAAAIASANSAGVNAICKFPYLYSITINIKNEKLYENFLFIDASKLSMSVPDIFALSVEFLFFEDI